MGWVSNAIEVIFSVFVYVIVLGSLAALVYGLCLTAITATRSKISSIYGTGWTDRHWPRVLRFTIVLSIPVFLAAVSALFGFHHPALGTVLVISACLSVWSLFIVGLLIVVSSWNREKENHPHRTIGESTTLNTCVRLSLVVFAGTALWCIGTSTGRIISAFLFGWTACIAGLIMIVSLLDRELKHHPDRTVGESRTLNACLQVSLAVFAAMTFWCVGTSKARIQSVLLGLERGIALGPKETLILQSLPQRQRNSIIAFRQVVENIRANRRIEETERSLTETEILGFPRQQREARARPEFVALHVVSPQIAADVIAFAARQSLPRAAEMFAFLGIAAPKKKYEAMVHRLDRKVIRELSAWAKENPDLAERASKAAENQANR